MEYSDEVVDRVRRPTRVGALPADAPDVGVGEAGTFDAGAVTRVSVRVAEGRVAEARFKVFGCSAAIASASLVAEWLEGSPVGETDHLVGERVANALSLPAERAYAADLAVSAARGALDDWRRKTQMLKSD